MRKFDLRERGILLRCLVFAVTCMTLYRIARLFLTGHFSNVDLGCRMLWITLGVYVLCYGMLAGIAVVIAAWMRTPLKAVLCLSLLLFHGLLLYVKVMTIGPGGEAIFFRGVFLLLVAGAIALAKAVFRRPAACPDGEWRTDAANSTASRSTQLLLGVMIFAWLLLAFLYFFGINFDTERVLFVDEDHLWVRHALKLMRPHYDLGLLNTQWSGFYSMAIPFIAAWPALLFGLETQHAPLFMPMMEPASSLPPALLGPGESQFV